MMASDVIIIGGGIIGLSIADRLARGGVGVTLLERGVCGREASWASAGVLKPGNPNRRGPIQDLQLASLGMFADYCADLLERSGIDPQYRPCQSIELLFGDQRFRMAKSEERAGAKRGMFMPDGQPEWQMLTPVEARELEPNVSGDCRGVLLNRLSAQVRNPRLLRALAASCRAGGVQIREQTPVKKLLVEGDRVTGVATNEDRISAKWVIICAGTWSAEIDARLAAALSTYPVRGQVVLLDAAAIRDARFGHIVSRQGCYLVPRSDGLVLVGATVEQESGFNRRNTPAGVAKLLDDAMSLVPSLAEAGVAGMWAGLRPGTPDHRPIIGPVPGWDGLMAATGHYRTGLAFAPVTAEIVADLVATGTTKHDLHLCLPGRFT